MIYLLLLCVFRYCFAVVESWAFSDLVINFLFLNENLSGNILTFSLQWRLVNVIWRTVLFDFLILIA